MPFHNEPSLPCTNSRPVAMCVSKLLSPSRAEPIRKPRKAKTAPQAEANDAPVDPKRGLAAAPGPERPPAERESGKAPGASGATVAVVVVLEVGTSTGIGDGAPSRARYLEIVRDVDERGAEHHCEQRGEDAEDH